MRDKDSDKAVLIAILEVVNFLGYRFGYERWLKIDDIIDELLIEFDYLSHEGEIH